MILQRCKKHIANPLIDVNGVPTCNICGPEKVEQKQTDTKKRKNTSKIGDFSEVTCTLCKQVKKRKKTKGYDYVDEQGGKWLRRRCPDCRPTLIYKQNIKRERKLKEKKCRACKKKFRPKNIKQVYCSPECTQLQRKVHYAEQQEVMEAAAKISEQYKNTLQNLAKHDINEPS